MSESHWRLPRSLCAVLALAALTALLPSCKREDRDYRSTPPTASPAPVVPTTMLQPGGAIRTDAPTAAAYQENRWAVSEGMRLYNAYNCVGCHANGGGAIGPPLGDREWIYGSEPAQVFATIVQGRPNGMPSFGGKIGTSEVWRLVAYVRTLGKLTPRDTWPARQDDISEASPVGNGMDGK
jgi:cytochrome c oxidase cbb3-type subunit 3